MEEALQMSMKGKNLVQDFAKQINQKPAVSVEQQVLDKVIKESSLQENENDIIQKSIEESKALEELQMQ